uniref:Uncharacterized protein n=1 Tax=Mycena chlorophos TaxID=658473 RepID=A0ABQ0KYX0_MYCCL|nr:predicted protein [Mycena chlorophos]
MRTAWDPGADLGTQPTPEISWAALLPLLGRRKTTKSLPSARADCVLMTHLLTIRCLSPPLAFSPHLRRWIPAPWPSAGGESGPRRSPYPPGAHCRPRRAVCVTAGTLGFVDISSAPTLPIAEYSTSPWGNKLYAFVAARARSLGRPYERRCIGYGDHPGRVVHRAERRYLLRRARMALRSPASPLPATPSRHHHPPRLASQLPPRHSLLHVHARLHGQDRHPHARILHPHHVVPTSPPTRLSSRTPLTAAATPEHARKFAAQESECVTKKANALPTLTICLLCTLYCCTIPIAMHSMSANYCASMQ